MALEALLPDAKDIAEVLSPSLKPCPFCGGRAVTHQSVNRSPDFARAPVYRSVVNCTSRDCGALVGYNSADLDDARQKAAERWDRRP